MQKKIETGRGILIAEKAGNRNYFCKWSKAGNGNSFYLQKKLGTGREGRKKRTEEKFETVLITDCYNLL